MRWMENAIISRPIVVDAPIILSILLITVPIAKRIASPRLRLVRSIVVIANARTILAQIAGPVDITAISMTCK